MNQMKLSDYQNQTRTLATDGGEPQDPHFNADEGTVSDAWTGAYIYTSWGYGQTAVDMAQIVDVSDSGKTVLARMVRGKIAERHRGSDSVQPSAEQYGDEFRLRVRNCGSKPAFRGSYPYINGDMSEGKRLDSFLPFSNEENASVHQTPPNMGH